MNTADRFIERVEHLPPAPAVVSQLLGLFNDPNREIDRITDLISYDPSLTAEVLKRCNSAFFRGAEPASDIFEAVTRLGLEEVYTVVAALVGVRVLSLDRVKGALDAIPLWQHSVTAAVAAGLLARQAREPEAVAFTAGLLHDIGKLVLASVEGATYAGLLQRAGTSGAALVQAEEVAFGVNHADVGARLLARWGMPHNLTLAVLHHHHPPTIAGSSERLLATVHLANVLAHHVASGAALAMEPGSAGGVAVALLQITEPDLPPLVEQTRSGVERIQGLLKPAP